jgi:hypothetical protein
MTIAALIIIFAAAAVASAIGLGAGFASRRLWGVAYPLYWFAAAGAVVGAGTAALVIGGPPGSWFGGGQVAVDDVLPYMETIKQREPALYERIETSVIRDQYDGLSTARVRSNAKALVISYVADKSVYLVDELTYELTAATRDALGYLAERSSWDACAHLALGRVDGDVDSKLSAELVERNANNTVRVITAERREDAPAMPAEEFAQLAANAFAEATQVTGIPPEEVDTLLAGSGDPTKTCKLMKAFFDAVLAQPISVAAAALRTLASGERRANAI